MGNTVERSDRWVGPRWDVLACAASTKYVQRSCLVRHAGGTFGPADPVHFARAAGPRERADPSGRWARRWWCSGTIEPGRPRVDAQAGARCASVRISAARRIFARSTCVFQLKYADVLRAREIRVRGNFPTLLPTDLAHRVFRAQRRKVVKPERREDSRRRPDGPNLWTAWRSPSRSTRILDGFCGTCVPARVFGGRCLQNPSENQSLTPFRDHAFSSGTAQIDVGAGTRGHAVLAILVLFGSAPLELCERAGSWSSSLARTCVEQEFRVRGVSFSSYFSCGTHTCRSDVRRSAELRIPEVRRRVESA